jgi:hypothetical protein
MLKLRSEVVAVARACERLISETMMKGDVQLTDDECQVLYYYAGELLKVTQIEPAATTASLFDATAMESRDIPEAWPPCTIAARRSDVDIHS